MYLADGRYLALWPRKFGGEDFSYIKAIALVRLSPLFFLLAQYTCTSCRISTREYHICFLDSFGSCIILSSCVPIFPLSRNPLAKECLCGGVQLSNSYFKTTVYSRAGRVRALGGRIDFFCVVSWTAMAVPRVLAAILENRWGETEGVMRIPECRRGWMGWSYWAQGKVEMFL